MPFPLQVLGRSRQETLNFTAVSTLEELTLAIQSAFPLSQIGSVTAEAFIANFNTNACFSIDSDRMSVSEDIHGGQLQTFRDFVFNITGPGETPLDVSGNEFVTFSVRVLRHKLFSRSDWIYGNADGGMFASQPAVLATCRPSCTNASLSFSLNAFYNGLVEVEISMNHALNVSRRFILNVSYINQQPFYKISPAGPVYEDSGLLFFNLTDVLAVPDIEDEAQQKIDWTVVVVPGNASALIAQGPRIDFRSDDGTPYLYVQIGQDVNGYFAFAVTAEDDRPGNNKRTQQVALFVTSVNDAPSFSMISVPVVVLEDMCNNHSCSIHNVTFAPSLGPADEEPPAQTAEYVLISSGGADGVIVATPTISFDGILSFQTVPHASGEVFYTVTLQDSGGVLHGGEDESEPQTLTICVLPVNDRPTFTLEEVLVSVWEEESGADVVIENFATEISASSSLIGSAEENGAVQELTFDVFARLGSTDVSELFTETGIPKISSVGELSFSIRPYRFGSVTFHVTLRDSGGVLDNGVNVSLPQNITVEVRSVNQRPTFTMPVLFTTQEGSSTSITGFATATKGEWGEDGQQLTYTLTPIEARIPSQPYQEWEQLDMATITQLSLNGTARQLFLSEGTPTISADGTLSFVLAPERNGQVRYRVRLQDDGGILRGGQDTAVPDIELLFEVLPVNSAPTFDIPQPAVSMEGTHTPGITLISDHGPGSERHSAACTMDDVTCNFVSSW